MDKVLKIDCHVHVTCDSVESGGYCRLAWPQRLGSAIFSRRLGTHGAKNPVEAETGYVRQLQQYLAASELDAAVLLAFDETYHSTGERSISRSHYYVPNNYVMGLCRSEPRFHFGASVHPNRNDALDELDRVRAHGAVLVKLLPNSHHFNPANARYIPFYRKLAALKMPLLLHGGFEHTIPATHQSFGDPARFRLALDEGCTVIVAHAGSAGLTHLKETMGAFLKLLRDYPHCYGDTSALTNVWRSKYLKQLLAPERLKAKYGVSLERPFERFIHGSDYPVPITPAALGWKIAKHAKRSVDVAQNPLQLDIELKRAAGVPDECLTRGAEILRLR